jgi:RNA polymerase sigma-70 factor (ECF subfamily)
MDDAFLIRKVLGGQRDAFRLLVLRWQRPVFRFLGLLGLPPPTVEDLAQETFLRVFRNLGSFDASKAKFSTWLFTIARRLAANEIERGTTRRRELTAPPADVVDPAADQLEALATRERGIRLRRALTALPEPLRAVLLLSQVEGLSLEEVAGVEGCAVGTVKSRMFRARKLLRTALAQEEI